MKRFAPRKGMHPCKGLAPGKGLAPRKGMVLVFALAMGPATAQAAIMTGSGPITGIALSGIAGQLGFFRIGPSLPMHAPAQGTGSTQRPQQSTQRSHPTKGSSAAKGSPPAKGYTGGLPVFHDDYCEQYGC
ncbi:hypothetical protein Acife_0507 [Acidithiobacillus ferrivorans SS3]|uniref:Uncharacterized protein n=1 Tax=Acidithiobacillus ferrivorans SS3 TaxID=743299 RepID=G0JTW2_9PROT|nr:hypothetical protein [Acidithiobacillus ferrivorans]AEM46714.1 hypothetical protein Acife_0507 [Acidithiobacillus ferrivorans SS3]